MSRKNSVTSKSGAFYDEGSNSDDCVEVPIESNMGSLQKPAEHVAATAGTSGFVNKNAIISKNVHQYDNVSDSDDCIEVMPIVSSKGIIDKPVARVAASVRANNTDVAISDPQYEDVSDADSEDNTESVINLPVVPNEGSDDIHAEHVAATAQSSANMNGNNSDISESEPRFHDDSDSDDHIIGNEGTDDIHAEHVAATAQSSANVSGNNSDICKSKPQFHDDSDSDDHIIGFGIDYSEIFSEDDLSIDVNKPVYFEEFSSDSSNYSSDTDDILNETEKILKETGEIDDLFSRNASTSHMKTERVELIPEEHFLDVDTMLCGTKRTSPASPDHFLPFFLRKSPPYEIPSPASPVNWDGPPFYPKELESPAKERESPPYVNTSPASPIYFDGPPLDPRELATLPERLKKKFSLPYYQMPKPTIDDYLLEIEKNLQVTPQLTNESESDEPLPLFKSKDPRKNVSTDKPSTNVSTNKPSTRVCTSPEVICLDDSDDDVYKTSQEVTRESDVPNPIFKRRNRKKKVFTKIPSSRFSTYKPSTRFSTDKPSTSTSPDVICLDDDDDIDNNNKKCSRNLNFKEYNKVISDISRLGETKSPGIKRSAFKEYLTRKINQKKFDAFNRSKEVSKLDEEMHSDDDEGSVPDEVEKRKLENENLMSSSESDEKEQTVSFVRVHQDSTYNLDDACESDDENSTGSEDENSTEKNDGNNTKSDDGDTEIHRKLPSVISQVDDLEEDPSDNIGVRKKVSVLQEDSSDSNDSNGFPKLPPIPDYDNEEELKQCKREMDRCIKIYEQRFEEAQFIEPYESSLLNPGSQSYPLPLEPRNNGEGASSHGRLSQVSSSLPSYQPGGGFLEQENQNDSSDSENQSMKPNKKSKIDLQPQSKFSGFRSSSLLHSPVMRDVSENLPGPSEPSVPGPSISSVPGPSVHSQHGIGLIGSLTSTLALDNPPLGNPPHYIDLRDIFSTQDLANVCSGPFQSNTVNEKESEKHRSVLPAADLDSNLAEAPKEKVNEFFDNEAEISGEEDGLDDDESDDDDSSTEGYEEDEKVPPDEDLRDKIADLHMKHVRDDDDELLNQIKEKFLEDGELNNDGTGRTRKFAWKNNDSDMKDVINIANSSESDTDAALDETWSSINQEKAKWHQENKEKDFHDEPSSSSKKKFLKVNILGKQKEFIRGNEEQASKNHSCKRPRGSFLHLDDSSASQVLKKLKTSEDDHGGSRTTKHFVFRNDLPEDSRVAPGNLSPADPTDAKDTTGAKNVRDIGSIFRKI